MTFTSEVVVVLLLQLFAVFLFSSANLWTTTAVSFGKTDCEMCAVSAPLDFKCDDDDSSCTSVVGCGDDGGVGGVGVGGTTLLSFGCLHVVMTSQTARTG
jgi:hypothetical protein